LSAPILVNTIPAFIDNLAEAVSPNHPRPLMTTNNTLAEEHGGERARLTQYSHSSLIKELHIFRLALLFKIKAGGISPTEEELHIIHTSIDDAILKSATTFNLIQAEIREQVIATLGHDMRTPLSAAMLSTEILLRKTQDPEVIKYGNRIRINQKRLDNMIQDLLNTTLLKSGAKLSPRITECNIRELAFSIIDLLPSNQKEKLKIESEEIVGFWDSDLMKRSLENLISNAFKYGDADKEISLQIKECNKRLIIIIHNFGEPIQSGEMEAIFQIFKRVSSSKGKKQGWGLGLPFVKAVAEVHAGSLTVESSKESGTSFLFDIPIDARPFLK
jgi:signal transduction histidine kinase